MASHSEEAPIARATLITLAVLVLYVLSTGPVWLGAWYRRPPIWVEAVYYPITWTAAHCEPADKALQWYVHLWQRAFYRPL